jgi:hypothetical protein
LARCWKNATGLRPPDTTSVACRGPMASRSCWPRQRQAFGQQHRLLKLVGSDALRQFQIRYRHTTTSRPA